MLKFNNLNALRHEPSRTNHAIRLEPELANAEISGSAVTANVLLLLRRAAETGGLKLTATGNLSRAVVDEMCGIIKWLDYQNERHRQLVGLGQLDFGDREGASAIKFYAMRQISAHTWNVWVLEALCAAAVT